MDEKLLTTDELAEFLQIPKSTIYNWNSRGETTLPRYKIGVQVRYRASEVEAWLAEHAIGAPRTVKF